MFTPSWAVTETDRSEIVDRFLAPMTPKSLNKDQLPPPFLTIHPFVMLQPAISVTQQLLANAM